MNATDASPHLRVGCPMWAHKPWVGRFLSPGRRGSELAEYATWCTAVEGNTTFYAVPAPTVVARWAEQAPADFRFAFKVPRTVTHEHRLRAPAGADLTAFLRAVEPLGERIGPIQLQLPPGFGPEDLPALRLFCGGLPRDFRWVVELRHPGFFDGGGAHRRVDDVLAAAGVGRVVLDTRPLYAEPPLTDAAVAERRNKPRLPVCSTLVGPEPVVRVIGGDTPETTLAGLGAWVPEVTRWLAEGRRPYVFVHQPENRSSPDLARRFHALVAGDVAGLVPLPDPWPLIGADVPDGQESLF